MLMTIKEHHFHILSSGLEKRLQQEQNTTGHSYERVTLHALPIARYSVLLHAVREFPHSVWAPLWRSYQSSMLT